MIIALAVANLINLLGNWALIYGHLGMPVMGIRGSAYATVISRIVLAVSLFGVSLYNERGTPSGMHDVPFQWETDRVWRIFRLGWPAAMQITLEVGVFAVASTLAARIGPMASAANLVVLNIAGLSFMIPDGLGSAAAGRVIRCEWAPG